MTRVPDENRNLRATPGVSSSTPRDSALKSGCPRGVRGYLRGQAVDLQRCATLEPQLRELLLGVEVEAGLRTHVLRQGGQRFGSWKTPSVVKRPGPSKGGFNGDPCGGVLPLVTPTGAGINHPHCVGADVNRC